MMNIRQLELLENLRPGHSAHAVLLHWNGQKYMRSHETVEAFDFVGIHGHQGDRFYGYLSPESGRWEAIGGLYEQVSISSLAL